VCGVCAFCGEFGFILWYWLLPPVLHPPPLFPVMFEYVPTLGDMLVNISGSFWCRGGGVG